MIRLTDDGTMDTVIECSDCGEEFRGNYDPWGPDMVDEDEPTAAEAECAYEDFTKDFIDEVEMEHDCTLNIGA